MCERHLVTVAELAGQLSMKESTLADILRRRNLPRFKIGTAVRVDPDELLLLLKEGG